jgi:hypothetical protein
MIQPEDVWAFALEQELFGQQIINTFALKITAAPVNLTEVSFMSAQWGNVGVGFNDLNGLFGGFQQLQTGQVKYVAWHVRRVVGELTNNFVFPITNGGAAIFGLKPGDCETANVALSIERKGLAAGRRSRGRIAVAGLPTTSMAGGRWDASTLVSGTGLAEDLVGQKVTSQEVTLEMGFWSPEHEQKSAEGVVTILPSQFTFAVSATPKDTVRVQRSRTVSVGS